jgi:replicative DNA helicase
MSKQNNNYYKAFRSEADFQTAVLNEYCNMFRGGRDGELIIQLQDKEMEEAVIGALLVSNAQLWPEVNRFFVPGFWYNPVCEKLAGAIRQILENNGKVDIITAANQIRKMGLDETISPFEITRLASNIFSDLHLRHHVQLLYEKYLKRQLLLVTAHIQSNIATDVDDLLSFTQENLDRLRDMKTANPIKFAHELMPGIIQEIENKQIGEEHDWTDLSTTFPDLDQVMSGFTNADLIVIGARPSQGKTAFALNMLNNWVKQGVPVGFFSAEMSDKSIITRLMSMCSGINARDLKGAGKLKISLNILRSVHEQYPTNFMIDDTPNISVQELKLKAKKMKRMGARIIVVDYLQLITSEREHFSREQEVSYISRSLKGLAKELNVPVVVLAQLNREAEKRPDGKPITSDLRDSGGIEQDADQLMFLYDPAKYGLDSYSIYFNNYERNISTQGLKIIITAKNRNGAIGETPLAFLPELTLFASLDADGTSPFGSEEMGF